jgi:hypothetical protein
MGCPSSPFCSEISLKPMMEGSFLPMMEGSFLLYHEEALFRATKEDPVVVLIGARSRTDSAGQGKGNRPCDEAEGSFAVE